MTTDRLERQMRAAGWRPGRSVGTVPAEEALTAADFVITAEARAVLAEFGGLTFYGDDGVRHVWIDGAVAATDSDAGWTEAYETLIGMPLVAIGGYSHMAIFLAADGRVFGGFDRECGFIGGNVQEMLDSVLNHSPRRTLNLLVDS